MSARCPVCDRLVSIRVLHVLPGGRYVYKTRPHDDGERNCPGGDIR